MLYMKASTPGDDEGAEGETPPRKELVVWGGGWGVGRKAWRNSTKV